MKIKYGWQGSMGVEDGRNDDSFRSYSLSGPADIAACIANDTVRVALMRRALRGPVVPGGQKRICGSLLEELYVIK